MARLNDTLIVYKRKPYKPVPNLTSAHRRNVLEASKGNGNGTENGGVAKEGKQATIPEERSVRKSFGTVNQFNNMVGSRAPVAQMIASTADGEEVNGSPTEQLISGRKAQLEERVDGEGDGQKDKGDNETEAQNQSQQEVTLPNSPQSRGTKTPAKKAIVKKTAELQNSRLHQERRTPLSRSKKAQQSTPANKTGLTEDVTTEKDTPRSRGSQRKSAGAMLTSGKEAEIVASAKKPKPGCNPSANPKALTKEFTPIVEQAKEPAPVVEQVKGLTSTVDEAEDEDGSEEENVTETIVKNYHQPDIVHQSRMDGENNKQWLIEWKGYPKQKDWTWESVEMLREDCPEWVEKKENGSLNGDTGVHEVEKILDKRKVSGKVQYSVKWDGWEANYNTWEPAEMLECDVPYMVEDFEKELKKTEKKRNAGKADMNAEPPAAKKRGRPRK
ncbi:hypothetical protein BOTCAL_0085g00010 [Botryotinia calthae]|uniref:Chromo domain-containing protein n=1 Tax=Botryotinia calthae TaxID=38488 RepID=A0A4Y8D9X0_9HELO|nr:hypothetical protein BOTCAL_0085g00010 [Botryotinia calthae]